jgi:HrpA-like RNA helicase/predicted RNA-binding protein with RPS1 domain
MDENCKYCEKLFSYSEEAYRLKAEQGESRFERCEECRPLHAREISEVKIPYLLFRGETTSPLKFNLSQLIRTSCKEQILQKKEKKEEDWDFSITDEEVLILYQMLEENQVVVMVSPTGTGKSTFIPKRLIEQPENYTGDFVERLIHQGQIIITQPRILATIRVPRGIAIIIGSDVGFGSLIGFRYSGADLSDRWNWIIIITDGTLPNWIREGRLGQYSLIFVDEAHERSCNIDLILGFLRRELPKYPQLRLIISSATINTQKFLNAFREMKVSVELLDLSFLAKKKKTKSYIHFWKDENTYILSPEGDLEKTTDCKCWLCQKSSKEKKAFWESQKDEISEPDLPEITATLVSQILAETKEGDILVFLHGEKAIKQTVRKIEAKYPGIKVIPAYRRIQEEAERELAKKTTKRRVIVGTNLLETSITIQGALYGIDSGFIKEAKWELEAQIYTLPTEPHSQEGRKQRWGRLGRTENGYVYNLYTKEEFERAEKHTLPVITRSCLEDFLVNLFGTGITEVEQFPWMESPSKHPKMGKEIQRAQKSLREKGVVDQNGVINERTLELLGIPRSSSEANFLLLADDQGVLFEAITALWLMSNREGEARTGANLYSSDLGLLLWEPEWDAKTKMKVWAIHQGLRVGCRDDLDFVIKLVYCFNNAKKKDIAREWAKRHFINYDSLQKILDEIAELTTEKFGEEREESVREIDITQLDKIRALMATVWADRIVELKSEEPITYPVVGKTKVGVVSPHCVGSWQGKKKAIVATAVEGEAVLDGYPQKVPIASFMVQLPGQALPVSKINLFVDQIFPVGSWVQVKEKDGQAYILKLEKLPPPIKVSYRKSLDFYEEYLEEGLNKEEEIPFDEDFLIEKELSAHLKANWISEQKAEKARIVGWREQNGIPIALLSPFEETGIKSLGKKIGSTLKVKIHQVVRDPIGKRGWIFGHTEEGFDIPIELSELSLSPKGPGLERIKGQILNLKVKAFDESGIPQLSNIEAIIADLRRLREEISESERATKVSQRKFIELPGFVTEINEEEEKAIVVVPREKGILHSFEVAQTYVPGKDLKSLRIGREVTVHLFSRADRDEIPLEYFTDEEIKSRPKEWELQEKKGKILLPFCLEDKDFKMWPARPEAIDFVKQHSWQFCLNARIEALKAQLSRLKPGDPVIGIVKKVKYERGTNIKTVEVVLEDGIPGFVFGRDLDPTIGVPSEGSKIPLDVLIVDPESGFLRLTGKVKDPYKTLKYKDQVKGKVIEIERRKGKYLGSISRLKVEIEVKTSRGKLTAIGFVPYQELQVKRKYGFFGKKIVEIPQIGEVIDLWVSFVSSTYLILTRKKP